MIPAYRWPAFARWFARHCDRRLRACFHDAALDGVEHLREALAQGPVLAIANHSSWWDAVVAVVLSHRRLGVDAYAMMDAQQLAHVRFFGFVGGFGVDRRHRRDGVEALRYAQSLLDRPGRLVWVFPQGTIAPAHHALQFEGGAARIAMGVPNLRVVPIGLRYRFGTHERPTLQVACGAALVPTATVPAVVTAQLRDGVLACLQRLDDAAPDALPTWFTRDERPGLATRLLDAISGWVIARGGSRLQAAVAAEPKPLASPRDRGAAQRP